MPQTAKAFFDNSDTLFFVNASNAKKATLGNGHGYYFNSPWVNSDLLLILKYSFRPEARGLIKPQGKLHWTFSRKHADRLQIMLP